MAFQKERSSIESTNKKRVMRKTILLVCMALTLSSCATVLGGKVQPSQKQKPAAGEPKRAMKSGFVVADILCGVVPLFVDLATGAIYRPKEVKK